MLEGVLIARWLISIAIIVLLLIAFYVVLRILKQQGFKTGLNMQSDSPDKMHVLSQLYIDSKNKVVKVKDKDRVYVLLVGNTTKVIEIIKEGNK